MSVSSASTNKGIDSVVNYVQHMYNNGGGRPSAPFAATIQLQSIRMAVLFLLHRHQCHS